jgi:hypothetical protein
MMCEAAHAPLIRLSVSVSYEIQSTERLLQRGGRQWIVREASARGVPGARRETCLICESAEVIRRIWDFPDNWRTADDESLWRLCDGSAR